MTRVTAHPGAGDDSSDFYAAIKLAAAAVERQDFEGALRVLRVVYEKGIESAPAEGLSLYGLCLSVVEKKNKLGIQCCERAIAVQSYDASHRVNLIKIYLANKSRRKAVEVLEQGLRALPKDPALLKMRESMRYRKRPVIPFLHRDNAANQFLGRLRYQTQIVKVVKVAFAAVFTVALFVITFLIALGKF